MSMLEELYLLLSINGLSVDGRVYPNSAPDQPIAPYVVYQRIFSNSENVLTGKSGLVNTRVQIDIYDKSFANAQSIFRQLDELMNGWNTQNVSLNSQDFYESDVKLHRVQAEYSIWHF